MRTIHPSIVRLHVSALDLPVFDYQGVALATVVPEDCGTLKSEVEVFGEFAGWVTKEADLELKVSLACSMPLGDGRRMRWLLYIRWSLK